MLDIELVTCSYGRVCDETILSVERLHNESDLKFKWYFVSGDALIGRSRSRAVWQYLKRNEAPFMLFLDGDIVFQPEDVEKVLGWLRITDDVVGGMYPVRSGARLAHYAAGGQLFIDGSLQIVQFLSTGFMGIPRKLLLDMIDRQDWSLLHEGEAFECYPFFESGGWRAIYLSEDWDFCNKVHSIGRRLWLDTSIRLSHLGERIVTTKEALDRSYKGLTEQVPVVQELAEFLGKTTREIIDTPAIYSLEPLITKWKTHKGTTEDFYINNEQYLYNLACYNENDESKAKITPLQDVRDLSILDFGCGIGTISLALASRNNKVVGYDINPLCIEFCNFRREKRGLLNIYFTTELPNLDQFDLIVALATFEHIENLEETIHKLGREMKVGAKLYHNDDFGISWLNPMHFDHSLYIDKWLKDAGFIIWDKNWAMKG